MPCLLFPRRATMSSFDAYMGSMYPGWAIASGGAIPGMAQAQVGINNALAAGQWQPQGLTGPLTADPAHYAAIGAAYGRATGGFGGYGAANADPFTPVSSRGGGQSVFN